ncbi:L-lysine exporter family protein LysE/ArgO [Thermosporothrix hazakensis]|jgi:L-lysine exporter family protein LysE/ArgO|uniref:L-lysine exporter family protein LysE/ArgO n=2 Tax=Thermosporothrix TaxID=768650 RepID=A0A326UKE7_THEHA|nr:LysE/ArgO family amino acid transporter [Thermosporothrix hazakensis]PZW29427.1 L-lysine exporter family protein LysE/ArgO [Thermosporothrix hazakensis]
MQPLFTALVQGFLLGASLIIAIGAQNAFVLRQGLKRQHVFITAALCTLCDIILILLGVGGLGTLITSIPILSMIATWGGAAFLLFYGFRSFRSVFQNNEGLEMGKAAAVVRVRDTVLAVLAFSLLNPHVYLDTVVLIGSISTHYQGIQRAWFAVGAMCASLSWFFSLAYGAAWLAPLFRRPLAWKILDGLIGCVMWGIAFSLIWSAFPH